MKTRNEKCTFDKAQYLTGDAVAVNIPAILIDGDVYVKRLEKTIPCQITRERGKITLLGLKSGSYGIEIENKGIRWEGAFDIVESDRDVIRYGYLTDFSSEENDTADVEWLRDLHVNTVQFYDWMYRHDQLLPSEELYEDPLGRPMSLSTVKKKITACHKYGMRAFAYGAVYASTPEMADTHPEWALYTMDGKPMKFAGWLRFMNINVDSAWSRHLIGEYVSALKFGFSGIHMDTYGFPKKGWSAQGKPLDLSLDFPQLITKVVQDLRDVSRESGVIFNAVNNWPVETVANSPQDAVYIEVWPPNITYYDLYTLIREAKMLTEKSVILAAYMKPFQLSDINAAERSLRLTWAAIFASGGTQLVFGENGGVLMDSYYVNYYKTRYEFRSTIQKYCDFVVRYADFFYADKGRDVSRTYIGDINEDIIFACDNVVFSTSAESGTIWTILRMSANHLSLQFVNLCGNTNLWNEPKNEPQCIKGIKIQMRLDRQIKGIYSASPDEDTLSAVDIPFFSEQTSSGRVYYCELPELHYWTVVWVRWEE